MSSGRTNDAVVCWKYNSLLLNRFKNFFKLFLTLVDLILKFALHVSSIILCTNNFGWTRTTKNHYQVSDVLLSCTRESIPRLGEKWGFKKRLLATYPKEIIVMIRRTKNVWKQNKHKKSLQIIMHMTTFSLCEWKLPFWRLRLEQQELSWALHRLLQLNELCDKNESSNSSSLRLQKGNFHSHIWITMESSNNNYHHILREILT